MSKSVTGKEITAEAVAKGLENDLDSLDLVVDGQEMHAEFAKADGPRVSFSVVGEDGDQSHFVLTVEADDNRMLARQVAHLRDRLVNADTYLRGQAVAHDRIKEGIRLKGKAEGVRLALSYLDEMTRGL